MNTSVSISLKNGNFFDLVVVEIDRFSAFLADRGNLAS